MSKRKKRQLIEAVIENAIWVFLLIFAVWGAAQLAPMLLECMGVG